MITTTFNAFAPHMSELEAMVSRDIIESGYDILDKEQVAKYWAEKLDDGVRD